MEKQKLQKAIARAIDSRLPYSFNKQKREVYLKMDDDLFDAVVDALSEE